MDGNVTYVMCHENIVIHELSWGLLSSRDDRSLDYHPPSYSVPLGLWI